MIIDDCRALSKGIAKLHGAEATAAVVRLARDLNRNIRESTERIDESLELVEHCASIDINLTTDVAKFQAETPAQVSEIRDLLFKDLAATLQSDEFADFIESLAKRSREIEAGVLTSWIQYVNKETPKVSEEVVDTLSRLGMNDDLVVSVQGALQATGGAIVRSRLPTTREVTEFVEAARQLEQAVVEMRELEIPPEVLVFIRQSFSEGVSLRGMTDIVHEWLAANELLDSFVVYME